MKVVVTIAGLDMKFGGPSRTVPALCRAMREHGAVVDLVTLHENGELVSGVEPRKRPESGTNGDSLFSRNRAFRSRVKRSATDGEIVVLYDVGLWLPSNHSVAHIARKHNVPLVVSPRGMLSPRALMVSKWKKWAAWWLYQKRDVTTARVLHAASSQEARDFRCRGIRQPIAVIPNGLDVPAELPKRDGYANKPRTVLFLSRLHPIKGLNDLVRAWAQIRPPGWRVVVAGPDENYHRSDIESLARTSGVENDFQFVGPVHDAKWDVYRAADLFVLPSHSESFGQVIAEALACGVPVITTQATPWQDLETHRCGWWIPVGAESLAKALHSATRCSAEELRAMGKRGQLFVRSRYTWPTAAERLLSVFQWIVQGSSPPTCILEAAR